MVHLNARFVNCSLSSASQMFAPVLGFFPVCFFSSFIKVYSKIKFVIIYSPQCLSKPLLWNVKEDILKNISYNERMFCKISFFIQYLLKNLELFSEFGNFFFHHTQMYAPADTIKYIQEAVHDEWLAASFFTLYMQHLKLLPSSHEFLIHSSNAQHIFF